MIVQHTNYSLVWGSLDSERHVRTHVIVGGYNATHYLNDVWVGAHWYNDTDWDITWLRLADAPLSLRGLI